MCFCAGINDYMNASATELRPVFLYLDLLICRISIVTLILLIMAFALMIHKYTLAVMIAGQGSICSVLRSEKLHNNSRLLIKLETG